MADIMRTGRLNLLTRVIEFKRTAWQIGTLLVLGSRRMRLAEEVIASGQCLQRKWELLAMMALVKRLQPKTIVEIGTYRGGTLRCWADVAPVDAHFISIDLPGGDFGGGYGAEAPELFQAFLRPRQKLDCVRADSHAASTKAALMSLIGQRPIDFLFIDGDHTYEGVKRDFDLYENLVRKGGLIGLHDIMPHSVHKDCRVHELWDELKGSSSAWELVDRDGFETWGGIGVVRR